MFGQGLHLLLYRCLAIVMWLHNPLGNWMDGVWTPLGGGRQSK
jgi:hypothetical protein